MSDSLDLTPEYWDVLVDALVLSGSLVIAASPQGVTGFIKESAAYFSAVRQVLRSGSAYALIDELQLRAQGRLETLQAERKSEMPDERQARREVLDRCREATQILMGNADPQESAYYKRGVLWACRQAALAAKEGGGFLGIGAQQITEQELEALRQIGFALGLPAAQALVDTLPEAPLRQLPRLYQGRLTAEEWQQIRMAPIWAAAAVAAASLSGPIGLAQELSALARGLQAAAASQMPDSLMALLVNDLIQVQSDGRTMLAEQAQSGLDVERSLAQYRQAIRLVEQKLGSQEAIQFSRLILDLASNVAGAAREGGVSVSAEEQQVLDELARISVGE